MYFIEEGDNYYGKNNLLMDTHRIAIPYVKTAMDHLSCNLHNTKAFQIVDYGTADGKSFVFTLKTIKKLVKERYGANTEIMATFEDVIDNDFKAVWRTVLDDGEADDHVFYTTSAISFYKQCMPSDSVHFAFTATAAHFLSERSLPLDDAFIPNCIPHKDIKQQFAIAAENDWNKFLLNRAKELSPGGVLLCINPAAQNATWTYWDLAHPILHEKWVHLYKEGMITLDEKTRAGLHVYIRTEEEHKRPFLHPESEVSKAGLQLRFFKHVYKASPLFKQYLAEVNTNNKDAAGQYATQAVNGVKAFLYNSLFQALDEHRSFAEKSSIIEMYFKECENAIALNPQVFKLDLDYHIIVIGKCKQV